MAYSVQFTPKADKSLRKLPKTIQERILKALQSLGKEPRPKKVKKLSGEEDYYRLRVGDYRVVYRVLDEELLVLVVKVAHRKDVYRNRLN